MEKCFVAGKDATRILGVHSRTLYQWETKGWIDTIRTGGNKRLYNVEKYLRERGVLDKLPENFENLDLLDNAKELKLSYVRVSTHGQSDDLERQKKMVADKYPHHIMIQDIGSGVNLNRRGLRKIIKLAIAGKVKELVVAYKDRLTRFGYELIEDIIRDYSGGKIVIIEQQDDIEPEEELVKDVLQIMNVFTAKMNGLRKYRKNC